MDSKVPVTFIDKCRLCLEKAGEINIYNTDNLAEDIFICTSVKVCCKEKLSSKICLKCLEIIYSAKNLKIIALNNNFYLHSLIGHEDDGSTIECNEIIANTLNKSNETEIRTKRRFIFEDDNNYVQKSKKHKNDRIYSSEDSENSSVSRAPKPISVRKDIFEPTVTVSLSTNSKEDDAVTSATNNSKRSSKSLLEDAKFECTVCQKTFDTKKKFSIHQRNHSKNLYCPLDTCGKKFATKGDVNRHIRTHTGERPYKCEACDKSFAQRGTLKAHRETVHGDGTSIIGK